MEKRTPISHPATSRCDKKEKVEHLNSDITGLYNDIDKQSKLIKDLQKDKQELEEEREWLMLIITRIPRKASSHLLGQKSQEPQSERGC